jgi:hypothetical protein
MYNGIIILITLDVLNNLLTQDGHQRCQKLQYIQNLSCVKDQRNLISVECGMGYCTPHTTSPYQTPSPFHFMTSLQSSGTDSDSLNSDGIQTA